MSDTSGAAIQETALDQKSAKLFRKLANGKQVRAAREQGVLDANEEIVGCVALLKRPASINQGAVMACIVPVLFPVSLAVIFSVQRWSLLLVTPKRVVLTPWYVFSPKKKFDQALRTDRPLEVARLTEPAKSVHTWGTKAMLSPQAQAFLGRQSAYLITGRLAEDAFRFASARPSS